MLKSHQPPEPIHPDTQMGWVHLTVADLDRQIRFYQEVIGLQLHWRDGATAGLGAGDRDLLRMTEDPTARRYQGTTGMYHFAILLPDRRELARAMARLFSLRYPNYPTDHIMTQTTYLDDPEGNNIELYADTPEEGVFGIEDGNIVARRSDGTPSDGREPLDVEALFGLLEPGDPLDAPMPEGTVIGHVHLYVSNMDAALDFYHHVLGFDNMGYAPAFRMGMVSVRGYHHHIGLNTWLGEGAPPAPSGALGLRYFTLLLPARHEILKVVERIQSRDLPVERSGDGYLAKDPAEIGVLLALPSE